jgi:hypothetical protein
MAWYCKNYGGALSIRPSGALESKALWRRFFRIEARSEKNAASP